MRGPRDRKAKCLLFAASAEETGPGEDPRREMDAAKGTLEARVHLAMQAKVHIYPIDRDAPVPFDSSVRRM